MAMQYGMGYGLWYDKWAAMGNAGKTLAPDGWRVPTTYKLDNQTNEYAYLWDNAAYSPPNYLLGEIKSLASTRQVSGTTDTNIHPRWDYDATVTDTLDTYGSQILPSGGHLFGGYNGVGSTANYLTDTTGRTGVTSYYQWGISYNFAPNLIDFIDITSLTVPIGYYQWGGIRCMKNDTTDWEPGDTVTDVDGNVYKTCRMPNGTVWMAENLRVTQYSDGTPLTFYSGTISTGETGGFAYPDYNSDYVYQDSIAPTGLTATSISYNEFDLSWINIWSPTVTGGTNNLVQVWISGNTWQTITDGTLSTTSTGMTVTGLTSGTEYIYRVVFVDDNNWYNTLGSIAVTTLNGLPPTGLTASNIYYTGFTLTWINNEVATVDSIEVQIYSGGTWNLYNSLPDATSATTINAAPDTEVIVRLVDVIGAIRITSSSITATTLTLSPPTGLSVTGITTTGATINWINPSPEVSGTKVQIRVSGTTIWTDVTTVSSSATTYDITSLIPDTKYEVRIVAVVGAYEEPSTIIDFETLDDEHKAPINLHFVSGGTTYTSTEIAWINETEVGDYNMIRYKDLTYGTNGGQWFDAGHVAITATGFTITGLIPYAEYEIQVVLVGSLYPSNSIFIRMPAAPPAFCSITGYDVSATTCGNSDGSINILNADYHLFYTFSLSDVDGNSISYPYTGLSAGYYFLTATVIPTYEVIYGRDICSFNWIGVPATDTTMSLDNLSVRNTTCGTFGAQSGRIVYFGTDSGTTGSYSTSLYTSDGVLVSTVTGTTVTQIVFGGLGAGIYYAVVTNNNDNCVLLIGANQIKAISSISVAGIKRIFVTEWNNLVEYNYWTAADEDYYVSGLDSDFFASIKIKEFMDSTLPTAWFEIVMDTKAATFSQVMNKTTQGFVFTDTLTLTIPHADNTKWKTLVDFLINKYIIVFQDNNGAYWCMGYRLGSQVDGYKRANNEFVLEIKAISDNKILTNIAEDYVVNNIINS